MSYPHISQDVGAARDNLLPGGNFDTIDSTGFPAYWSIERHGASQIQTQHTPGYRQQRGFRLLIRNYQNGDTSLISRPVPVSSDVTYFFKGFYHATTDFDLLVRYTYRDGSHSTQLVKTYPYHKDPWSTVSTVFKPDANVRNVQFIYHISSNGMLELDTTYLAKNVKNIVTPQSPTASSNLLPDGGINSSGTAIWQPYQTGNNSATLQRRQQGANHYLHTEITQYKTGEAKWQYAPLATKAGKHYSFTADYRSTAPTLVMAETVFADGKRTFSTLRKLPVSSEWIRYQDSFEAPAKAQSLFISIVLQQAGSVDTDNYGIYDITKAGPHQFARPLVSITFDDGWETDFTRGATMLASYGYRGTFYLNPSSLDTKNFMTTKQIHELATQGHQLASHGFEHDDMTTLSPSSLDHNLLASKAYIAQQSGTDAVDFASPYGKIDPEVLADVRSLYHSHRGTEDGINTRQNFDRYNLRVLFIGANTPVQTLQDALANAIAHHGWLILVYHSVNDAPIFPNTIPPKKLQEQLRTIQNSGLIVDTVQDVLKELLPQTD